MRLLHEKFGELANYDFNEENLRASAHPSLFVHGGNSSYLLEEDHPKIYRLFPKAQVQTIANAGHWLHAEKPEEFIRCVSSFLDSLQIKQ